jgi:hypothetical protein
MFSDHVSFSAPATQTQTPPGASAQPTGDFHPAVLGPVNAVTRIAFAENLLPVHELPLERHLAERPQLMRFQVAEPFGGLERDHERTVGRGRVGCRVSSNDGGARRAHPPRRVRFGHHAPRIAPVAAGLWPAVEPGFQPGGHTHDDRKAVEILAPLIIWALFPGGPSSVAILRRVDRMPPSTSGGTPDATPRGRCADAPVNARAARAVRRT